MSILRTVREFAVPAALLAKPGDDLGPGDGITGLQKLLNDLPDRLLPAPAVKPLAPRRPMDDFPVQIVDDDIGEVQYVRERGQFVAHSRSPRGRRVLPPECKPLSTSAPHPSDHPQASLSSRQAAASPPQLNSISSSGVCDQVRRADAFTPGPIVICPLSRLALHVEA